MILSSPGIQIYYYCNSYSAIYKDDKKDSVKIDIIIIFPYHSGNIYTGVKGNGGQTCRKKGKFL